MTVDLLLDLALAETRSGSRVAAVMALLPALEAGQWDRVWALVMDAATEVDDSRWLLTALVDYLDPEQLGSVHDFAWRTPYDEERFWLLRSLVPHLPDPERTEAIDWMIGYRSFTVLRTLGPLLSPQQAVRAARRVLPADDPAHGAAEVTLLAGLVPAEVHGRAVNALLRIDDEEELLRALQAWIPHLAAGHARALLPSIRRLRRAGARIELLVAVTAVLPEIAGEAVSALRETTTDVHPIRNLSRLARALAPSEHRELLTLLARDSPFRLACVLPELAPWLDDGCLLQALELIDVSADPGGWLNAAGGCLAYLSPAPRRDVQDRCVEVIRATGRVDMLPDLIGELRAEQCRALIPMTLAMLGDNPCGLMAMAGRLDRAERTAALQAARTLPNLTYRARVVIALAPHLDQDQVKTAATLVPYSEIGPETSVKTVITLAAAGTGRLHNTLTTTAIAHARRIDDRFRRGCLLLDLAEICRTTTGRQRALHETMNLFPQLSGGTRHLLRPRLAGVLRSSRVLDL